jgi:hypothetical protein
MAGKNIIPTLSKAPKILTKIVSTKLLTGNVSATPKLISYANE